ncbi:MULTISPECIES: type II toxin-antitoxin system VapC family toxin [unclassified Crossiella]|uniref:type II toxin-antitoxin system VapC family toxin n=1 Tax=unclassified Crossiella TaxID=2620835 RepID=UPI001FFEB8B0|nr:MULTISPECIES: type II toxin-antitoxin system VapC family toxin [unclassified Crossiella]MCK2241087.1 type II toxin-antitoxin system VapC family toxin [Crossiella sp. S99.2]MCK2253769.1 type II toxin-antitoxin system VapC family toxin [Crossiella sp. S99.1]
MIYLDSCALIKLIVPEPLSEDLFGYLDSRTEPLVSSELIVVEVHRALTRIEADKAARTQADQLLDNITQLPLAPVVRAAAALPDRYLRSLDALHLATALRVPTTRFVSYDRRLNEAAAKAGLTVRAPGAART